MAGADRDFLYRMGIADKASYWDEEVKALPLTEAVDASSVPQGQVIRGQSNIGVVERGPVGSIQAALKAMLEITMREIVARVPEQFKRNSVNIESPPGLIVVATLQGTQIDVVPATVRIELSIEPATLKEILAVVSFEDGTYDPRDYHNDYDSFRIDWVSPVEDLIGLVVRYINSRRKGLGA